MTTVGLGITGGELRRIADAVERLEKTGVRVESAVIGQHRVTLEWHDDQRDGSWYTVEDIGRFTPGVVVS